MWTIWKNDNCPKTAFNLPDRTHLWLGSISRIGCSVPMEEDAVTPDDEADDRDGLIPPPMPLLLPPVLPAALSGRSVATAAAEVLHANSPARCDDSENARQQDAEEQNALPLVLALPYSLSSDGVDDGGGVVKCCCCCWWWRWNSAPRVDGVDDWVLLIRAASAVLRGVGGQWVS